MAYYPFNPNQMTVDVSGRLGSLTIPNTPPVADCTTASAGPGGSWASNCVSATQTGARLTSSNSAAQFLQLPSILVPANFSVCLWYEPTPSGSTIQWETVFVLTQSSTQGGSNNLDINRDNTNNYLEVHTTKDTSGQGTAASCSDSASNSFAANQWTHVCATLSMSALTVYQNGVSDVITSALTGTPSSITNTWNSIFGCTAYPCFQGKIDEVRLYSKQLSATETLAIYNFRCDTYTTVLPSCCTAPMPNGQCSTTCTTICCPTVPSATNV